MKRGSVLWLAQKAGWTVAYQRSGHYKLWCPCGEHLVCCASTPSDRRAEKNILARLRACPRGGMR